MRFPNSILIALLLASLLGCSQPDPAPSGPRTNFVLVTLDTLRTDHLRPYGYHRDTAPTMEAFAAESLVFDNCVAPIPRTTPSHLSLMTGVYPYEHGVISFSKDQEKAGKLRARFQSAGEFVPTTELRAFAQVAREHGYRTGGFVSAAPVKRITGLAHGFDAWTQPEEDRRAGVDTNRDAFEWLESSDQPFFLWIHYMDAHGPYVAGENPPEPYSSLFTTDDGLGEHMRERGFPEFIAKYGAPADHINLYDGSVRRLDDCLAALFAKLRETGAWDDTVVVLVSDHGQGLGQHGYTGHGGIWDEQLRIPLMIRAPGVEAARVPQLMSLIDVIPTTLSFLPELADDDFARQCRGKNALAPTFEEVPVFGMAAIKKSTFSLTTGKWKFIRRDGGEDALYDLEVDPHELDSLVESEPDVAARLADELEALISEQKEANARYTSGRAEADTAWNEDHERELRKLGYGGDFDD